METQKSPDGFALQCENEAFSARRESVFGNLPVVELAHKEVAPCTVSDISTEEDISRNDDVTIYKGEESMFKRPMPKLKKSSYPPRRHPQHQNKFRIPDHKKNPHKWVKYNLATTSEVTDKSNTAAALSFLRELDERKRKAEPEEPVDPTGKIVFKKPKTCEARKEKNKTYRDGKLCMPAFEFGSKKPKENKKQMKTGMEGSSQKKKMQRCLSHLKEDGDDDEDHSDGDGDTV